MVPPDALGPEGVMLSVIPVELDQERVVISERATWAGPSRIPRGIPEIGEPPPPTSGVLAGQGHGSVPAHIWMRFLPVVGPEDLRVLKSPNAKEDGVNGVDCAVGVAIDTRGRPHVGHARCQARAPSLADAAASTVERWRWEPPAVDGVPGPVVTTVRVTLPSGG